MDIFLLILLVVSMTGIQPRNLNLDDALAKKQTTCINGIFTILILASHYFLEFTPEERKAFPLTIFYPSIRGWMGQLVVVSFLFYSGYGIMEQTHIRGDKYIDIIPQNRIFKVWLHYAIAVCFFCVFNLIVGKYYSIKTILASFVAWESIGNSNWYVFAILMCYLIFFVAFKFFDRGKNFVIMEMLFVCYIIAMRFLKTSCWYNTILAYSLGIIFSVYKNSLSEVLQDRKKYIKIFIFSAVFTITLWIYVIKFGDSDLIFMIFSLFFCLDIVLVTMKFKIQNSILFFLGKYSFEIYILQRLPMQVLEDRINNKGICFIMVIVSTILIALPFRKLEDLVDKIIIQVRK